MCGGGGGCRVVLVYFQRARKLQLAIGTGRALPGSQRKFEQRGRLDVNRNILKGMYSPFSGSYGLLRCKNRTVRVGTRRRDARGQTKAPVTAV